MGDYNKGKRHVKIYPRKRARFLALAALAPLVYLLLIPYFLNWLQ